MTKILLLDDVELLLELERSFLGRRDCEVLTARTGEEVLEMARAHRPGVIVLDVPMGGMGGLAACRALKEDPDLRRTPVIFASLPVEHERCVAAGANAFVSRPARRVRLLEAIRRFVPAVERVTERFPVALRVDYRGDRGEGRSFTKDIGGTGLFVKTRDPFEPGDVLELAFALPPRVARPIRAAARVVHTIPARTEAPSAHGVGAVFRELSAADHLEISRFIRERAGSAP